MNDPTSVAPSDAEIHSLAYDCNALPEVATDVTIRAFARAVLAKWGQPAKASEPVAWQPIETAPRGKIVLVHYKNRLGNGRTVRAWYYLPETLESDTEESGWADEGWYEESEAYEYLMPLDGKPTHWMPLPPSPDGEARKPARQPLTDELITLRDVVEFHEFQLRQVSAGAIGMAMHRRNIDAVKVEAIRLLGRIELMERAAGWTRFTACASVATSKPHPDDCSNSGQYTTAVKRASLDWT